MAASAPGASTRSGWPILAVLAVCGLAGGLLLDLLTAWVSSSGPSSADGQYTLRGNGALIVPIGGGLVLLTAAWTALVVHWLGQPRELAIGAVAGAIDLAVVLVAGLVIDIYAPAAWRGSLGPVAAALWLLAYALPVVAPVVAAAGLRSRGAARAGAGWMVVAMILAPASLFAGAALGVSLSQLAG